MQCVFYRCLNSTYLYIFVVRTAISFPEARKHPLFITSIGMNSETSYITKIISHIDEIGSNKTFLVVLGHLSIFRFFLGTLHDVHFFNKLTPTHTQQTTSHQEKYLNSYNFWTFYNNKYKGHL